MTRCNYPLILRTLLAVLFTTILAGTAMADAEPKQVFVEAQIVETSDSFSRDLGVEFGIDNLQDAGGHGLSTGAMRGIDQVPQASTG